LDTIKCASGSADGVIKKGANGESFAHFLI